VPIALVTIAVVVGLLAHRIESRAESPFPLTRPSAYVPGLTNPGDQLLGEELPPVPLGFKPGETLAGVLDGLGLAPAEAAAVIEQVAPFADPRKLKPTDTFRAGTGDNGELDRFEVILAGRGRAVAVREEEGWRGSWRPFERSVIVGAVRGRLQESLEASIRSEGGEGLVAYLLSDVFQWDLDFNRDLRVGDQFEILYEKVFLDGGFDSLGSILAATYTNQGRRLEAYRFGEGGGFYDAEGRPMRKRFLRSPLAFSRITSGFSSRRFHPVLKSYRPHYGIDYGAPTGTPVRVTAGGVVDFAGWNQGGGRMIKVRHTNGYLTAYLHLSKFAANIRPGRRVSQGDVIGYVGSTGLATAPHLDYRVQYNGSWINPLSLKSVPAEPLPESLLGEFLATRDALREGLETGTYSAPEGTEPPLGVVTAAVDEALARPSS
jgi:murein DD-endopeptidase MepM/ murein hydrolase activator NlpD